MRWDLWPDKWADIWPELRDHKDAPDVRSVAPKTARNSGQGAERTQAMAAMFAQGVTLKEIGAKYCVTRERVRQILKSIGVEAKNGGKALSVAIKRDGRRQAIRARVESKWGVSYEVWREARSNGLLRAYEQHRNNSISRAIPFHLTFGQWLSIWQISGKLHLRGVGKDKYCMSRLRDSGAYEVGNVHIQQCSDNSRDAVKEWRGNTKDAPAGVFLVYPGRDKAWLAKVGKVKVGYFPTAEAANDARLEYIKANGLECDSAGRLRKHKNAPALKVAANA